MVQVRRLDGTPLSYSSDGWRLLADIANEHGMLRDVVIEDASFSAFGLAETLIKNVRFVNCTLTDINLQSVGTFENVSFVGCIIKGADAWTKRSGITISDCKINIPPTNEELEKIVGGKIFSLPNKDYVKVECMCDFCHNKFYEVMARANPHKMLKEVPQSDRRVCDQCYKNYDLRSKIPGQRTYGYHGSLSFYKTPMDRRDTEILGLEMEFEGNFFGWKELQDAHRGHLHYGYDSSVKGQNELSWDCGSYSYWKYLAPLKDVCEAVKNGGGSPGDTAGIHIHVSTPDTDVLMITHTINNLCRTGVFKTMMEAVSLRNDRARFDTYANLGVNEREHHAGISYNGHGTCEFRVFNSCLDDKTIMHHLKFCKELYHMVKTATPKNRILDSFSKETKRHIITCAKIQAKKGFITDEQAKQLIDKLGA